MRRRQFLQSISTVAIAQGQSSLWKGLGNAQVGQNPGYQESSQSEQRDFFYRPRGAWAGDFIPFYKDGKFRIFFEPAWHDPAHLNEGIPWSQITTEDFVHFTEYGQVLPAGNRNEQDFDCYTGAVIEAEGLYHMFYDGVNRSFPKLGKPEMAVMHAVSRDLLHWTKVPEDTFSAPSDKYDPNDWRDPFVFWNEESKEYWMLVVARLKNGPRQRRGCTALCASRDLKKWEVREPFWAPSLYVDIECPDLFRIGDWWYLVYSEFSEQHRTHYRMSRSLKGPWLAPEFESFDGRAFYAAKTASDGHRRFAFGWNPTRYDAIDYLRWNCDSGLVSCKPPPKRMVGPSGWDWGGNLVVHELNQELDGSLSVKVPDSVDRAFSQRLDSQFQNGIGPVEMSTEGVRLGGTGVFACSPAGLMPRRCKIETTVVFERNTRGFGLMLRASDDLDSMYYIRFEPFRNRLVLDTWPRPGDIPFDVGVERPLALSPGAPIDLKVFVDGSVCVVYADRKVAMSTRLYDLKEGRWGVFVTEGSALFKDLRLSVP